MKEEHSQSQKTRHSKKNTRDGTQSVSRFLAKTYEILQKQEHDNIISWNPEGNGFIVKNITKLTEEILPRYFKHNNFASFVRQLNMYGFHKIKSPGSDAQVFTHPKFLRGDKDALRDIKRKIKGQTNIGREDDLPLDLVTNAYQPQLSNQVVHLKKKQDELERVVDVLVEQNKQILQDNKRLWKRLKKTMEREDKKFQNILLLFLLNGGKNSQDILTDKQIEGGNSQMKQALLPVEEPKRQRILDALLSRFNSNNHKNNYKDQLYNHNQGEHLKLINNIVNHLNLSKEDKQQVLELEDGPSNSYSPLNFPNQDRLLSPIPHALEEDEEIYNLNHLSLQKGISSEFPDLNDSLEELSPDFLQQK